MKNEYSDRRTYRFITLQLNFVPFEDQYEVLYSNRSSKLDISVSDANDLNYNLVLNIVCINL